MGKRRLGEWKKSTKGGRIMEKGETFRGGKGRTTRGPASSLIPDDIREKRSAAKIERGACRQGGESYGKSDSTISREAESRGFLEVL